MNPLKFQKLKRLTAPGAYNSGSSSSGSSGNPINLKIDDLRLSTLNSQEPTTPIDKLNTPRTVTVPTTTFFPPSPPPLSTPLSTHFNTNIDGKPTKNTKKTHLKNKIK